MISTAVGCRAECTNNRDGFHGSLECATAIDVALFIIFDILAVIGLMELVPLEVGITFAVMGGLQTLSLVIYNNCIKPNRQSGW